MPHNTPKCKVDNVTRHGGKIYFCENNLKARVEMTTKIESETGAVFIAPFNDSRVISGQGTIAVEFLQQIPHLDAIFVPISGGGMISGIAIAAKKIKPEIKIFAAEPKGADDAAKSKAEGRLVTSVTPHTMADGLRASMGSLTWPIVRDFVDAVITVGEDEILNAMRMCFERMKIVVEPSGAVGLAAVLSCQFINHPLADRCQNIGVVLCGGNIDLDVLWESLEKQWC